MQLTRIDLLGFRQLVNRSFDFKPGLNLIYGPNEAGKSSLMESLAVLLYGFFESGRISVKERDLLNQHKPWLYMGEFGGVLEYILDSGNAFQLRRTYAPETSTAVIRLADRRNVTNEFPHDSDGRVYVAEEQLGISKSVFENVCVVRQSELALLEQSATSIAETIIRLSSTMALDGVTVKEALEHLESTYKQKVGTTRAYSKPLATTQKRVKDLEKEITEARAARDRSWNISTSINVSEREIALLSRQQLEFQALLLKKRLNEAISTRERIAKLQYDVDAVVQKSDEYSQWKSFRQDLYERILNLDARRTTFEVEFTAEPQTLVKSIEVLKQERQTLLDQIETTHLVPLDLIERIDLKKDDLKNTTQAVAVAQSQVDRLHVEFATLQSALDGLASDAQYIKLGHSGLAKLKQQYENARSKVEEAQSNLLVAQMEWKRVNITDQAFLVLKNTPINAPAKKGCRAIGRKSPPPNTVPSEIAIYNDLLPIYTRRKNAETAVSAADQSKNDLDALIRRELYLGVREIDEKVFSHASDKIDQYLKATTSQEITTRALDHAKVALETAQAQASAQEAQLTAMFPSGVQINQNLRDGHQRAERLKQRLAEIGNQLASLESDENIWQKKHGDYRQLENDLNGLYQEAGIDDSDPLNVKLQRYKVERDNYFAWVAAASDVRSAKQRLQDYPADTDKLAQQIEEAEAQLQTLMNAAPSLAALEPTESREWYQSALNDIQTTLENAKRQTIMLQNEAIRIAESDVDLASLSEDHATATARLKQLEWFGASLQIAEKELADASSAFQQQFTPRLQAFLDSGLNHATDGRYTKSLIDPETLDVQLLAPEIDSWIKTGQLSSGTRDLVYLLLRFSIARLMSRSSEKFPMFLDDPFVHCDRSRKANILTYLVKQASEVQFILFTQDEWTLAWLRKNYPECNVISMSREGNANIDYDMVEDLLDESDAVRKRLQAIEDEAMTVENKAETSSAPDVHTTENRQQQADPDFTQSMLRQISDLLATDETMTHILTTLYKAGWQAPEAVLKDALHGEFLSTVVDRLNERFVDLLGDQVVYMSDGLLIVTEEYRTILAYLFT